ncbi:MAG TPA: cupin domain-containing protein, partial [Rhodospirillales bacterium]
MTNELKLPAVDPTTVDARFGSNYPTPFAKTVGAREKKPLGDAAGLKNFGVNLVRIPAGAMSSQRHCHSKQDEFVFVLEGELVLATDLGEQTLTPGMAAGFPAGSGDGHHLLNRTDEDAV